MRAPFLLLATLLAGWCGSVGNARAQDAGHASAAARALFHEGVTCADARDWACAADRFGRARAVRPSPVILSNYGIALGHLGRYVEASEVFRALLRDPSASADLSASARQAIARITPHIGTLTVVVSGTIEGVAFTMDGESLDASLLGVALPSDPGAHRLEARRAEVLLSSETVEVVSGAHARVEMGLPAPAPRRSVSIEAAMSATTEPAVTGLDTADLSGADLAVTRAPHHEVYEEWWFWTIIGVVVVGAGVGVTAAVLSPNETTLPAGSLGTIDVRP